MRLKLAVWVVLMVLVVALDVSAQTPRVVRQSGVVRDGAGQPRAGAATLTFGIYAEAEGGAPLWTEVQAVTLDRQGRYAVTLGALAPEGLPLALFTSGEARWLGVAVDGEAELPRIALLSVPYALQAADAETVAGKPLSAFVLAGEQTGTGADGLTYVNTKLLQGARAPDTALIPVPLASVGTSGRIGKFINTTDLGDSVMFENVGRIGLGTMAPLDVLHTQFTNTNGQLTGFAVQNLGSTATSYSGMLFYDQAGALGQFQGFNNATHEYRINNIASNGSINFMIGSSSKFYVASSGNIGVGTTTPAQKLSVAGIIESTTGGFKFPDGTTQASAGTAGGLTGVTAGAGISVSGSAPSPTVSVGTAAIVNGMLGSLAVADANIAGVSASKITGSLPVAQVTGAATLGANAFTGTQTTSGNIALPNTSSGSAGVVTLGGTSFLHNFGSSNAFVGASAGNTSVLTGGSNTGVGASALNANTTGAGNAAFGAYSLLANTTGSYNAAVGVSSLRFNTTGSYNAAVGAWSLNANTTGNGNTAVGEYSLYANTTGYNNAAVGTTSLYANTTGYYNAAFGSASLEANTIGSANAAVGTYSLFANTTGYANAAFGRSSLANNTTGADNIAIGVQAGSSLTTGNFNIAIGNTGIAAEASTIRIGTTGNQTRTFIAGISGVTTSGAGVAVLVDATGQLGTVSSSRRVKDNIADMDAASRALMMLRPVTFHYKTDQNPSGRTLQYGLIAEEVAAVYPGLVARSADGQIETVLYQFLPPMLLNEYQKQQRTIEALRAQVEAGDAQRRTRDEQIHTLADQVAALTRAVAALSDRRQ